MAAALLAACVLTVITLIPSGVVSLKKAEDIQAATAYGLEVLETRRAMLDPAAAATTYEITLNQTTFQVTSRGRAISHPGGRLVNVVVEVTWNRQPQPVLLSTRVFRP